jgi:hypothetical protein
MHPITQDLADYIVSSGFLQQPTSMGYAIFLNNKKKIIISMNAIQVLNRVKSTWVVDQQHTGGMMTKSFKKWAMLLDVMDAISLKENFAKARNESVHQNFQPLINML